jgi:peptide/nickel transport system permease protein
MIAEGRGFLREAPWIRAFPGLAIVALGASVTLFGDGLADFLRPEIRDA